MRSLAMVAAALAAAVAVVACLDLSPAGALPPSPDSGAELVARWCADCHQDQASGEGGPSFATIAASRSDADIRAVLSHPHARPMGGFALNTREIQDVTAYIRAQGH